MPRDALVDFTGGIAETFNLKSQVAPLPDNLFDSMLHAFKQKALMGAGIFVSLGFLISNVHLDVKWVSFQRIQKERE